jgi:hypothetical protein
MIKKSIKFPKKWIGISIDSNITYIVKNFITVRNPEDINPNYAYIGQLSDIYLKPNILNYTDFCKSPTSCDFLSEPLIDGHKKYFYVDQQDLVKWYVTNDKYVYADYGEETYIVANNISEFLELMNMENSNYYLKISNRLKKTLIKPNI